MLEISNEAEEAIRGILAQDGVPEGAAFRISSETAGSDPQSGFAVSITEEAPSEDEIVEGDGFEVRVEPVAAEILDDKQLDASLADGQVRFSLRGQGA